MTYISNRAPVLLLITPLVLSIILAYQAFKHRNGLAVIGSALFLFFFLGLLEERLYPSKLVLSSDTITISSGFNYFRSKCIRIENIERVCRGGVGESGWGLWIDVRNGKRIYLPPLTEEDDFLNEASKGGIHVKDYKAP